MRDQRILVAGVLRAIRALTANGTLQKNLCTSVLKSLLSATLHFSPQSLLSAR